MKESSYKIFSAINDATAKFIKCKLDIVEKVMILIDNLRKNYNYTAAVTKNIIRKLENCSNRNIFPLSAVACKSKISVNTLQEYSTWRVNITKIVFSIIKILFTYDMYDCNNYLFCR